jgi:hypothetical protein
LYWNFFVLTLTFYNCFELPLDFGYTWADDTEYDIKMVRDVFVQTMFMIDMLLQFRISYFDEDSGEEIFDWRMIGRRYLTSYVFYSDFISSIPWGSVFENVLSKDGQRFIAMLSMFKL